MLQAGPNYTAVFCMILIDFDIALCTWRETYMISRSGTALQTWGQPRANECSDCKVCSQWALRCAIPSWACLAVAFWRLCSILETFFFFLNSTVIDWYGANHSAGMLQRNSGGIACEVWKYMFKNNSSSPQGNNQVKWRWRDCLVGTRGNHLTPHKAS